MHDVLHITMVVVIFFVVEVDVDVEVLVVWVVSIIADGLDNGKVGGTFTFTVSGNGVGLFVVNSIGVGGVSITNSGQLKHG